MKSNNDINENKFYDEVIRKGYRKPTSKVWKPNHFNDSNIYNADFFLYVQLG